MNATRARRLAAIRAAGTLVTTRLNSADHWLQRNGYIAWTSEPLARQTQSSAYRYRITATGRAS